MADDVLQLDPKTTTEKVDVGGDFANIIPLGAVISAVGTSTMKLLEGTDSNPPALIPGVATFSGSKVTQRIVAGGIDGNKYCLTFKATLDDGQELEIQAHISLDNC